MLRAGIHVWNAIDNRIWRLPGRTGNMEPWRLLVRVVAAGQPIVCFEDQGSEH